MKSAFGVYLWSLLSRPFKLKVNDHNDEKDTERYVETLGEMADSLKQVIFLIRRSRVPAVAPDNMLDFVSENRKISRYPGERNQYFRRRIQAAVQIYAEGGTNPGMKNALARIGYPNTEIYEVITERARHDRLKKYNGTARHGGSKNCWSEFDVILKWEPSRQFTVADLLILIDVIYKTKSGHAMPRSLIVETNLFRHRHNGQHRYNREIKHDTQVILQPFYDAAAGKINLIIRS